MVDNIILNKETAMIPKNTQASISKGVQEGFPLMVNGLVEKYHNYICRSPKKTHIIVTGGESRLLRKKLQFPHIYDPLLTLKGLLLIEKKHSHKRHF